MKTDLPLHTFVSISKLSGFVKYCTCSCKANELGRCSHVSALLLFLSDFVENMETPMLCHLLQKNVNGVRIQRERAIQSLYNRQPMHQHQQNVMTNEMYNFDSRPAEYRQRICTTDLNNFVSDLSRDNS